VFKASMLLGLRLAKQAFRRLGLEVQFSKNTLPFARRRMFKKAGTDLVFDVGANRGQYAQELRSHGYGGRLVSFEPLPACRRILEAAATQDELWKVEPTALGREALVRPFHVTENLSSSSFFRVLERSTNAAPQTRHVETIEVEQRRLDSYSHHLVGARSVHLKLDTQGSELEVLSGASGILGELSTLECELSLTHLYEGQPLIHDVLTFLYAQGFRLAWVEGGFSDPAGMMLQADGLFIREPM
jgi:FkbM family methyltransferase